MKPIFQQDWTLGDEAAAADQLSLSRQVIREDAFEAANRIAGVDVQYCEASGQAVAAMAIYNLAEARIEDIQTCVSQIQRDYSPGLLAYRELPAIAALLQASDARPDLMICDGHGLAHPRRLGVASHLGLLFDIPTLGCAKTNHIGSVEQPGRDRGETTPIVEGDEVLGACLRTRADVKPVFVSTGHRISLPTAIGLVLSTATDFRLPEPIRAADHAARMAAKQIGQT